MTSPRSRADALLDEVNKERGGQLKVFLGAAPGVGKTFAMLNAARELQRQGTDVVVGIAETHGRRETEALLEGLEVLARRLVPYKGREIAEFDLDAALARRPAVLLVDELAHTNAPGSRHERRYQDVQELLDAGVTVYTTVNVQHLETLNDKVHQITGVRVRETVPDSFFERLRDIVLVDLPPRELIERLRQGKVYVPEQAASALQSFFSPSNLTALRELAMQTAADRVDADLREYMVAHGLPGAGLQRRVLVAIDGRGATEYLVRAGKRFAERRQAPWTVVTVDTGGSTHPEVQAALESAFDLARRLGAETVTLRAPNVVDELLAYANQRGVASIVIGRTRERPLLRAFNRTLTQQLLQRGAHFELTIINTPHARARARRALRRAEGRGAVIGRRREWVYATTVAVVSVFATWAAERFLGLRQPAIVFLTAVLLVAVRTRLAVALYTAVLCFLAFDFFFTEPRLSLSIHRTDQLVAVFLFLVAAVVCSKLADRLRQQVAALRAASARTYTLQALGQKLAAAADEGEVLRAGAEELAAALSTEVVVLTRAAEGEPLRPAHATGSTPVVGNDLAAADWSSAHRQEAGHGTETLASAGWWFLPLGNWAGAGAVGVLAPSDGRFEQEQRELAEVMVRNTGLAAERTHLVRDLESARVQGETERLRAALLASVSHDLRSPLASMIGAATSLSSLGAELPASDRAALLDSILQEGGRLDRYIQNLLDMTRLGHGGFRLERDWVSFEELAAAAAARLRKLHPDVETELRLPGDLRLLWVHPALLEQALFNILENAAKFSPPKSPVRIEARESEGVLIIDVTDRGPGIPETERRRIFDMFYSVGRGDRGREGTGLGLAIVRGMIGAHGGSVEALQGEGGVGTMIRIRLPLAAPPESTDPNE